MTNPALEFVKFLTHAISLDEQMKNETHNKLRGPLFRQLKVGQFSPEAEFHNPCLSYSLHDVICEFCNAVQSLELCRDETLLQGNWQYVTHHPLVAHRSRSTSQL